MSRLIGIDVGTSATKAVLVDECGAVLKTATCSYPLHAPQPGWAEQDPHDWSKAVIDCLREIGERKPDAIGLTGQMHGMVVLDSADRPIRDSILWCDQRTELECQELDSILGKQDLRAKTCNPPMTGFQIPKVLWLRKHEANNFRRTRSILLPKDYARLVLTGDKATDVTDASGTGAFDVPNRQWWWHALERVNVDRSLFPQSFESTTVTSTTLKSEILDAGVPVVAGAGDQAAGAVGTGTIRPGIVSVSLGTSGVVFACTDRPRPDPSESINVFCHANGAWHAMGVMLSCGGAVKWAHETWFPNVSLADMDTLANSSPIGADGLTFLPYLSGERCPMNDPNARAALSGLTLSHSRKHIARSVIEGATFGLKGCFDLLGSYAANTAEMRVTGGGANSRFWIQMIADVLHIECVTVKGDEGPALGAALLAGVGVGVWKTLEEATSVAVRLGTRFTPTDAEYGLAYERYKNLYPSLKV